MGDDNSTSDAAKQDQSKTDAGRRYEFGLLDQDAKKELRRTALKAVAIPGYQVPFASREMPIARGFGTGGLQLTLALIGPQDVLKVIDQGADESVNACNIRHLVEKVCPGVKTTLQVCEATLIQTRHRVPEEALSAEQILIYQVPYPDPLVIVESNETTRVKMHGESDYARLFVKLYEDVVHFDDITLSHRYPTRINEHFVIDPSPIPRWDVPKLDGSHNLHLFGAGREKKVYAVPPYTSAKPLEFEDVRFRVEDFLDDANQRVPCMRCGAIDTFLDELYLHDGSKAWACSDSAHCSNRLGEQEAS